MLTLEQYNQIKQVKDSNVFTCNQSLSKYIEGVKTRMSRWYGVPIDTITDLDVYHHLVEKIIF